jgi:WD40 repeat protein
MILTELKRCAVPKFQSALLPPLIFLIIGCGGSGNPITTSDADVTGGRSTAFQSSHSLLWYGFVSVDPERSRVELLPARNAADHFNVRKFVEDGPCTDCLGISNFQALPDGVISLDVRLTHPFPGLDQFTGFDVRGIAMFNGSEHWPSMGLDVPSFESGDGELLNPDGYTRLFNPVDFPPGSMGASIWEYSKGKLAPDADLTATLNGYCAFETDSPRRFFATTTTSVVNYLLKKSAGPFVFGYAVDACWIPPDPALSGDPYLIDVPSDFAISANCPEAYELSTWASTGLLDNGSGSAAVYVDVYDWQDDAMSAGVRVECPGLFDGLVELSYDSSGPDYDRFSAQVANDLIAPVGWHEYMVEVADWTDASSPMPLAAYEFGSLSVGHFEPEIIPEPELIVEITDIFDSPFCAKVDTQTDTAYVNSTQLSPVWDTSIRSISSDEIVGLAFNKLDMNGWMGLSVEGRSLITPTFVTMSGWTEIWDLDDGSFMHYYLPVDPVNEIDFLSDGEIFHDIPLAVVCDSISAQFYYFDYTNPSPIYTSVHTTNYPSVFEADYEGHRLFLYCLGGGPSSEVPTIHVYDVETWTELAQFETDVGVAPFWSDLDYDPVHKRLFFGSGSEFFEVWDSETYEHIDTISTGVGEVVGLDHIGKALYVTAGNGGGHLLVYDIETLELLWDVPCGIYPTALACNPNNKKIYVPDIDGQSVFVFQD